MTPWEQNSSLARSALIEEAVIGLAGEFIKFLGCQIISLNCWAGKRVSIVELASKLVELLGWLMIMFVTLN